MKGIPDVPSLPMPPDDVSAPEKPRPCAISCSTTVMKLYLPGTPAPLVPNSQSANVLLKVAAISLVWPPAEAQNALPLILSASAAG